MKKAGVVMAATDARRFPRTPFHSVARYWCAADDEGSTAACRNLGRGGLSLTMGRYLRPGRFMMLEVADPADCQEPVELKGRVVWCRAASDPCMFVAGVHVFHDDPQSVEALVRLVDRDFGVPDAEENAETSEAISLPRRATVGSPVRRLASVVRSAAMVTLV